MTANNPNPKLSANCLSKLTFWWLLGLFRLGKRNQLRADELYDVLPENLSERLGDKLERSWQQELAEARKKQRKASLWRAIRVTFGWSFVVHGISLFILNIVKMLQPLVLAGLIRYFKPESEAHLEDAYTYASALVLVTILQTMIVRHAHLDQSIIGMRVRIACSSLVYRKVLKLSSTSAGAKVNGLIINLLSNDLAKFEKFFLHLHYTWIMPVVLAFVTYLIWRQLGVAALAGILFMTVQIIPTQVLWYKMTSKLRAKSAARTDKRVLLVGQIVKGIRVIKMYAWEKFFERLLCKARKYEIEAILKQFYVKSVSLAFAVFTHRAALFCTIFVYVRTGNAMSADLVFSSVNYFMLVRVVMARFFPEAVFLAAEVNVSIGRIEEFLLREEIGAEEELAQSIADGAVSIKDASASWGSSSSISHVGELNLRLAPRKLYAVVGPVASGKSSLLKLILGELHAKAGEVAVSGRLSYASQEPWLFSGSVRDNILFGEKYEQENYRRITNVCALAEDLEQLPFGDATLVGERGMSLSGGQRARVNLARAVYRDADIYLLDDPFSAVDTRVARNLFDNCVNGLLNNKTRILVTHQAQYLREADQVIVMSSGAVEFQGTYQQLVASERYLARLPAASSNHADKASAVADSGNATRENAASDMPALRKKEPLDKEPKETEELLAKGRIAKSLYLRYFKAGGSYFRLSVIMLFFVLTQAAISGFDYWLSFWTNEEQRRAKASRENSTGSWLSESDEYLDSDTALYVCGSLVVAIVLFSNIRNLLFYKRALKSSENIHNKMFSRLLRTPMQFFNLNPSGRIVNRFSKDTGELDNGLPNSMLEVIERIFFTLGVIAQILAINWWTLAAMIVVSFFFVKINEFYLSTAQAIKRLESNAKSPVFSLASSTLLGLATIRSCRAQKIIGRDFDKRQDAHTAAHYLYLVTSAAYGFWLDFLSIGLLIFLVYSFILLKNEETFAGDVGLALTQVLTICGMLQFVMKQTAELMAQMTSVERMFQFTKLEQEGSSVEGAEQPAGKATLLAPPPPPECPKDWPSRGEVRFDKLYLSYSDGEQPVLKNLNLTISPNTKVGIVGRTGAGKSSLVAALFRLAKYDGALLIDNVNTKNVELAELRSKISIIPQEATLFASASLRDNLDPLREHEDASLWSALEEVEMAGAFETLEQAVDCSNLSAGQRQLLCLARAILKKNKILVLDEATANVDPATDELIQRTIRARFRDCTVLTIAHRLNTIMDSDVILVLDAGLVLEFDRPEALLSRTNGYFASLLRESASASLHH